MRPVALLLAFVVATIPFAGCLDAGDGGASGGGDARELETRTLAHGQDSGWHVHAEAAIDGQDRWDAWWSEHAPDGTPQPAVDFSRERVLALVLGDRPDTCHTVEITRVVSDPESGRVVVTAVEDGPDEGEGCGDAITQPHHVVAVANTREPVEWDVTLWEAPGEDAGGDASGEPTTFAFEVIQWSNATNEADYEQNESHVIATPPDLERVWSERRQQDAGLAGTPPAVDFSKTRVVAFFVGKPDPCHGVHPTSVQRAEDGLVIVDVAHKSASGGCPAVIASVGFFVTVPAGEDPVLLRHHRVEPTHHEGREDAQGGSEAAAPVEWARLDRGQQSGIHENRTVVVDSDDEWAALWENHTADRLPPPERPSVDFTEHRVLAVFMGERPSGCYGVDVASVHAPEDRRPTVVANVTWVNPQPNATCAAALTYPFVMITIPAGDGDVAIDGRARTDTGA